jgi:hypothetical protein
MRCPAPRPQPFVRENGSNCLASWRQIYSVRGAVIRSSFLRQKLRGSYAAKHKSLTDFARRSLKCLAKVARTEVESVFDDEIGIGGFETAPPRS